MPFPTGRSQDDQPKAGDTLQIVNSKPRTVVFWRGTNYVQASVDFEKVLRVSSIEQIERLFSITLTKDESRSDEHSERYTVS